MRVFSKPAGKDRWRAAIVCNGKRKHLGYFKTKREAAKAYDEAAKDLHGEFAVENFPDGTAD